MKVVKYLAIALCMVMASSELIAQQALLDGDYISSCKLCRIVIDKKTSERTLSCTCKNKRGYDNSTSLILDDEKKALYITNRDGNLQQREDQNRMFHLNDILSDDLCRTPPDGTYQSTCQDCKIFMNYLICYCQERAPRYGNIQLLQSELYIECNEQRKVKNNHGKLEFEQSKL